MNLQLMLQAKLAVLKFIQSSFLINIAEKLRLNESTLKKLLTFVDRDDFENALKDPILSEITKRKNINLAEEWNIYLVLKKRALKEKFSSLKQQTNNPTNLNNYINESLINL